MSDTSDSPGEATRERTMGDRPNILFLFPDQLRRDFLSCYGASFISTPNIDWIAETGVRYDNAYSASPLCVPARTALLTGMNAIRNGVTDNLHALRPDYNEAGIRTWPQILAGSGYYTAAVGKMHFYPWDARHGFHYRVICEDKLWPKIRDDYYHYLRAHGLRKLPWNEYGGYLERKGAASTDVPWEHSWDRYTGREARRFIEAYGRDGPFALMVGFPGPHDPYDPAVDFPTKFDPEDMPDSIPASQSSGSTLREAHTRQRRGMGMDMTTFTEADKKAIRAQYAGLVKQIDIEVGEIVDTLRRHDLLDSTVIIFSTDHGDYLGDHGLQGKASFYEAATHIPLLVRLPESREAAVCPDLVELRDVTATMLRLAGHDLPAHMDARPLPELGIPDSSPRSRIFGMLTNGWMALDGDWKLSVYSSGDWHLTDDSSGEAMLFNLREDPLEQRNLIDNPQYGEVSRRLEAEMTREIMGSLGFAMHDRLVDPYSLSQDEDFGREGWRWRYPASASQATRVPEPY